jgi:hypothetical protein
LKYKNYQLKNTLFILSFFVSTLLTWQCKATPANAKGADTSSTSPLTTYYISNSGSTSNTGLSPSSPWPFSKVTNKTSYGNGVKFLFHRGETFTGTINTGGYFPNPTTDSIIYDAYGAGAKPIITTMDIFPNSNISANWKPVAGLTNVWVLKFKPYVNYTPRVWLNGKEYQRAKDSSQINSTRRTSWGNTDFQFLYVYSIGNPAKYYSSITSASFSNNTINIDGQNYVAIRNLDVRGSQGSTIDLAFSDHVLIENCVIGKDGNKQGLRVNSINGLIVKNNIFDTGERIKQDFNFSTEGGDGIIIGQGNTQNVEVYKNYFLDWRHSSIVIQADKRNTILKNINIHHNYATARDIDYGRAALAYFYHSDNVRIEKNTFRNFPVENQFAAKGFIFRYNIVDSFTNIPYSPYERGTGIGLSIGHRYFPPEDMEFSHNTISNCATTGIEMNGHLSNNGEYADVKNNIIANNTFINNGYDVKNPYYDTSYTPANTDIIMRKNVDVLNNKFIGNKFYRKATDKPIYYGHDKNKSYLKTLSEFNVANGTAGDIITGNIKNTN